nr:Protein W03F11.5 [Haemonchus contortus]
MPYCSLIAALLCQTSFVHSQSLYTLPPLEGSPASGRSSDLVPSSNPRGIFHYSDTDNTFQSNFKVPDFETLDPMQLASELMSAAAKAENKRKTISGINLPLPFAGKPLNFQMTGESQSGLSFTEPGGKNDDHSSNLSPEVKEAFQNAKRICLESSSASCDEALDTFHRLKYGESLLRVNPELDTADDDPTTSFAKMLVPALGEKLEELQNDSRGVPSSEKGSSESREEGAGDGDADGTGTDMSMNGPILR